MGRVQSRANPHTWLPKTVRGRDRGASFGWSANFSFSSNLQWKHESRVHKHILLRCPSLLTLHHRFLPKMPGAAALGQNSSLRKEFYPGGLHQTCGSRVICQKRWAVLPLVVGTVFPCPLPPSQPCCHQLKLIGEAAEPRSAGAPCPGSAARISSSGEELCVKAARNWRFGIRRDIEKPHPRPSLFRGRSYNQERSE